MAIGMRFYRPGRLASLCGVRKNNTAVSARGDRAADNEGQLNSNVAFSNDDYGRLRAVGDKVIVARLVAACGPPYQKRQSRCLTCTVTSGR
jgi:hypothetical protein